MDVTCETVFLKELQKNKAIILTKENTRSARDKKRVAWMAIQQVLVATSGREYSVQQLCKKWNNLQQRVKEKIRNSGADKVPKTLHERDLLCLQIIGPENLNLPLGPLDLNLGELKNELCSFDDGEEIPMVLNVTNSMDHLSADSNKLIDVMITNVSHHTNSSPKQSNESQVLDIVMSSADLKNNLVTSLASLQNSLSHPMTSSVTSSPGGMLHQAASPRNSDITLQDIDNIQTNIFTELANRISQLNGSNSQELSNQLANSAELSSRLANSHDQFSSQLAQQDLPGQFGNSPGAIRQSHDTTDSHSNEDYSHLMEATQSTASKRKRRCSNLSSRSGASHKESEVDRDIMQLKKEVLQLKKEKLQLKNEKTRMEIERMRCERQSETRGSQTRSSGSREREAGTQTLPDSEAFVKTELV